MAIIHFLFLNYITILASVNFCYDIHILNVSNWMYCCLMSFLLVELSYNHLLCIYEEHVPFTDLSSEYDMYCLCYKFNISVVVDLGLKWI